MALYELGKAHFAINSDGTFRYLGRLIKRDWYNISSKQWTFKYQFSKKDGIITDTVVVNYIPGTFKELEPKVIYTAEEKVAYEKEKRGTKSMAKFKVGDRVKVIDNPTLLLSQKKQIGKVLDVVSIYGKDDKAIGYYLSDCADKNHCPLYFDNELELVEPKEDKPSKVVYDYRGHDNVWKLLMGMMGAIIIVDQKGYCDSELRNHARARNIDLVMYVDRRKETLNQDPFKLNPHEFDETNIVRNQDKGDLGRIVLYKKEQPKNRIPDRVVFNQDKGKVTVLISKHLDGVAPYWAYTVKTSENDKYDAIFGFMLAYFKYLNRSLEPKEQKAVIERVFKMPQTKRFPYLMGVVEQELLKLLGTTKKVEEIILAITSPNADMNYINITWDYAEWKEMLRVHELETKREEQKAIRKEIKKHEQEIEKLKKKGV